VDERRSGLPALRRGPQGLSGRAGTARRQGAQRPRLAAAARERVPDVELQGSGRWPDRI
jgi:hypothetical protein